MKKLVTSTPARPTPIDIGCWRTMCNKGCTYLEQGKVGLALACFLQACRLNPANPILWYNLGVAHYDIGDLPAAITAYRQSIELDPEHTDAHHNLAIAYHIVGDAAAASLHYRLAEKKTT